MSREPQGQEERVAAGGIPPSSGQQQAPHSWIELRGAEPNFRAKGGKWQNPSPESTHASARLRGRQPSRVPLHED